MRNSVARSVALTGLLFALAIVLGLLESFVLSFLVLPPGVKLGLANIIVMYALMFLTKKQALLLVTLKSLFVFVTRGAFAGFLSLSGGIASFAAMVLLLCFTKSSLFLVSVAGSELHNLGQFVIIVATFGKSAFGYLPILIASGVVMGVLTACSLNILLPALRKTKITSLSTVKSKEQERQPHTYDRD